jgi:hypothetical protein
MRRIRCLLDLTNALIAFYVLGLQTGSFGTEW